MPHGDLLPAPCRAVPGVGAAPGSGHGGGTAGVTNVTDADVTLSTVYGIDVLTGTAAAPLRLGRPYGFA